MLSARPLLVLSLSFMAGLVLCAAVSIPLWLALAVFGLGVAALLWRRAPIVIGIILVGVSLAAIRYAAFTVRPAGDVSWLAGPAPVTVRGVVASDPQQHPGRLTFLLDAGTVEAISGDRRVSGTAYAAISGYARERAYDLEEGDAVALDGILQTPRPATNPGAFSWQQYLARRGVWAELRVHRPGAVHVLRQGGGNVWLRAAWRVRAALLASISAGLNRADAAVLCGILLGRRIDLSPALMAAFVSTGTVHILATAGLHVGIVSLLLMGLFTRITLPRKLAAALMILALWVYALMAGGRPSVTRAAFMASVYFGALLFERVPDLATSLAAAALVVLWVQPTALFETAFQLSFATVLGVVLWMPMWEGLWKDHIYALPRRWQRKPARWVMELIGLSLIAQLAAAPIVALAYNQVSVLGFIANLCVVPALFVLLPAGFLAAITGCINRAFGAALFHVLVAPVIHFIVGTVTFFAGVRGASLAVSNPPASLLLTYYALLYGAPLALMARVRRRAVASAADPAGEQA